MLTTLRESEDPDRLRPLRTRLTALHESGRAGLRRLEALPYSVQAHKAGSELEAFGATASGPRAIVTGWACFARTLPDGRQQIARILLPGDVLGLHAHPGAVSPTSVVALTGLETVRLGGLPGQAGGPPSGSSPGSPPGHGRDERGAVPEGDADALRTALALASAQDQWWMMVQVVRLGRQTALERVASLLLELRDRLRDAGLGGQSRFPMPLTQEVLASTLGLSTVHMNRTVQLLRHDGLITLSGGEARLLDLPQLELIADYVPARVSTTLPPGPLPGR